MTTAKNGRSFLNGKPPSPNGRPPPLQPASGTFRWLRKPDPKGQGGVLVINETAYLLSPVFDQPRRKDKTVVAWRLAKADATVYDVVPALDSPWFCDCGDYVFNRDRADTPELRECKHIRCLRSALPIAGQPVPIPVEPGDDLPEPPGVDGDPFAYS